MQEDPSTIYTTLLSVKTLSVQIDDSVRVNIRLLPPIITLELKKISQTGYALIEVNISSLLATAELAVLLDLKTLTSYRVIVEDCTDHLALFAGYREMVLSAIAHHRGILSSTLSITSVAGTLVYIDIESAVVDHAIIQQLF